MRTYFDSSVLVAAFVEDEEHHECAMEALVKARAGFTCTHALAEVFGTLTGGRVNLQLTPGTAWDIIEQNIIDRLEIVELSLADYRQAVVDSQRVGARGGAIFDLLHLQAARRGKARKLYTLNVRHFRAFASDLASAITLPGV